MLIVERKYDPVISINVCSILQDNEACMQPIEMEIGTIVDLIFFHKSADLMVYCCRRIIGAWLMDSTVGLATHSNDFFKGIQFHEMKVFDLLRKMNANKAAGPDGIQSKLIKMCAKGLAKPLTIIFNKSFKTGFIPKKWKLANVVPISKKR